MMTDNVRVFDPKAAPLGRVPERREELATDRVYLLYTSFEETLAAIPVASRLAQALRSRLTVIHFKAVSFGAQLEEPCGLSPVETSDFRARLEAEACAADARVCVCRDARAALSTVFRGRSLVVLGRHRGWWRTTSDRWRRTLEAAGHLVVVVDGHDHA
jgi:hypothetical protein